MRPATIYIPVSHQVSRGYGRYRAAITQLMRNVSHSMSITSGIGRSGWIYIYSHALFRRYCVPRVLIDGATCWTNSNPVAQQGSVIVQGRRVAHRERVVAWGAGKYGHGITDTERKFFSGYGPVGIGLYRRRRDRRTHRGHALGS